MGPKRATLLGLLLLLAAAPPARGLDEIGPEEDVSDLLATPPRAEGEDIIPGRRWAVLPEFGAKFTDRDLASTGITLDVEGLYSLKQREKVGLSIGSPHLGGDRFLVLF